MKEQSDIECSPATAAALDAVCTALAEARQKGLNDGDTVASLVMVSFALWAHVHGTNASRLAQELRRCFVEVEAARITELDARLFGETRGNA